MENLTLDNARTLVLNADLRPLSYNPLSLWKWTDAVSSIFKGKAYVVASYDELVARSPSIEIPVPSVIALTNFVYASHNVRFTRFNVYQRDLFKCVYCDEKFEANMLTFDHIFPRSKGGLTTWENICSACVKCNQIKNDRTLDEGIYYPKGHKLAGQRMKLHFKPYTPTAEQFRRGNRINYTQLHSSWQDFLYWDSELEE